MPQFETSVNQRVVVPELMDDPALLREEHERALQGLARLNRWSFGDAGLWACLRREAIRIAPRPLRVLDLATGSGDLPVRLALRARRAGLNLEIAGCDVSPTAIATARKQAEIQQLAIEFFQRDVIREELPGDYDVITASLFLHHLSKSEAIALLRKMSLATRQLVLVNDLSRSRVNLCLVLLACHLLSRSPVVRYDGPASVRAAFTIAEAESLAREAGLERAEVRPHFPCRWLLAWRKPGCS